MIPSCEDIPQKALHMISKLTVTMIFLLGYIFPMLKYSILLVYRVCFEDCNFGMHLKDLPFLMSEEKPVRSCKSSRLNQMLLKINVARHQ